MSSVDVEMSLTEKLERLRRIPEALEAARPKLVAVIKRHLTQANAAGLTPDGKPYQRTQDGHVPLRHGAKSLRVKAAGSLLIARVQGIEALHSLGEARGEIQRSMLPLGPIPPAMGAELSRVVMDHLSAYLDPDAA